MILVTSTKAFSCEDGAGNDRPRRILILEDDAAQAKLAEIALIKGGIDFTSKRVDTWDEFIQAIETFHPDIVLSDYKLKGFDGMSVLKLIRQDHPDIPVVMVTDSLGDVAAVELMRAGARDYVLKSRLVRLAPTVQHVLCLEQNIRARKAAERSLRETAEKLRMFRTLIDHSVDGIEVIDPVSLNILDVNEATCNSLGYTMAEMLSKRITDIDPTLEKGIPETITSQIKEKGSMRYEGLHRRKNGSEFPVEISARMIELDRPFIVSIARDITERKRAEAEIHRLNRVHKTLGEVNRALLRTRNETKLMKHICKIITECGGYQFSWIGLAHDQDKSVEAVAMSGRGKGYANSLRITWNDDPGGRGPVGTAVRTGQTRIVQDIVNDPHFEPWRKAATKYGYASCIALPLKEGESVFGTLNIYAAETSAFSSSEVVLLEEVASDLAFGITNLRTRSERDQAIQERQQYADKLQESLEDALQAISATVEMRDPYTAGHQRRVAHLATAIAMEMGLPKKQIRGIHLAAIVHDLGKIHIPAEMLSKPSRLTEIEYSLIKIHSQAGYDILKGIAFPWPIAQTVLQHHERLDGSGYPKGLKGEEIILEARILSVADVVEAISSHRPYRPGLGKKVALEEISKHSGMLYDPDVVAACFRLFREKRYRLPAP